MQLTILRTLGLGWGVGGLFHILIVIEQVNASG